ncbi:coadhesin-like [Stylophora pistillata]|uniref:coadhesin-like n=1 Tax=Stylophora pistillata TaxID=50429 RepID=UPI000C042E50|nr:coadhesin-like [Stylophora pistillata]
MQPFWILALITLGVCSGVASGKGDDDCRQQNMDLAIFGDISRSMRKQQRKKLMNFVIELIDSKKVSADGNHVALGTFSFTADIHNKLDDKEYYDVNKLKKTVKEILIVKPKKFGTRTDLALDLADKEVFTAAGGDRHKAKNVLIIVTDGKPHITKRAKEPFIPFEKSTKALEAKDVLVVVVGVGKSVSKQKKKMEEIAGEKGRVLLFPSFKMLSQNLDEVLEVYCALDGGYTEWSESECSVTCGGGVKTLTRTCTNPPPSNGGKDCSKLGPATMTLSCHEQECPIDGKYTEWKESECSATCGGGVITKTRTCTNPPPQHGGKDCSELGPAQITLSCNQESCAIDGKYTEWKESECSVTCAGGVKTFIRTCTSPPPSNGGKDCTELGPSEKTESCNTEECPIDGKYTEWKESECSATCGGGVITKTRTCTNPPPQHGGKDCSGLGPAQMTLSCNEQPCPPPCAAGLDVAIVLDKSQSVRLGNLKKIITFLGNLVKNFNPAPDADHFGLITFNKKSQLSFKFSDSQYHDRDALLQKIANEPMVLQYQTRTDLALIMARDAMFTEAGGDRPDKQNVMIVLTDGKPTHPKKDFDFAAFAKDINKDFEKNKINIVAVGIGAGVDENTLHDIAGTGTVVQVQNFDKLDEMMETIKGAACSG